MTLARSVLYQLLFVPWTLALGILYLPLLLGPQRWAQRGAGLWVRGALVLQRAVLGLGYEIRGRENLPPGACILAIKHQSAWETLIFHALLPDPTFVIKRSLLWLPLVGWYLWKSGQIAIDRKAGTRALALMAKAGRAALAEGRQVIVFPEGHRQPPGATGTYHPGIAALYGDGAVPTIPVALNSGLFWRRNALTRHAGTIVMEFLPALPPGIHRRAVIGELRARIEPATRALEAEGLARHPDLASGFPGRAQA